MSLLSVVLAGVFASLSPALGADLNEPELQWVVSILDDADFEDCVMRIGAVDGAEVVGEPKNGRLGLNADKQALTELRKMQASGDCIEYIEKVMLSDPQD